MGMVAILQICTNFQSPFDRRLHIKFEENWPSGFRGEVCSKVWTNRRVDDERMTMDGE